MAKSNLELLKAYKKSNKTRKARILTLAGYKTESAYLIALSLTLPIKTSVKATPKKAAPKVVTKAKTSDIKTIHNVFIMDDSGSMSGSKYNNGVKGIQELVKSIKLDTITNNTITIVDLNRGKVCWMADPKDVNYQPHNSLGDTPLYLTMGGTIDKLLKTVKSGNVLLNIVTDGHDNCGFGKYTKLPQTLKKIQADNNFTVTFVGTATDVKNIQNKLNVDASNTLVHDNTGAGMTKAFAKTISSRQTFSASVAEGRDVKTNFYKEVGTL